PVPRSATSAAAPVSSFDIGRVPARMTNRRGPDAPEPQLVDRRELSNGRRGERAGPPRDPTSPERHHSIAKVE
ncbi:hypothetical protein THAOC_26996, partial [Thalassiosira oceanica]